MLYYINGNYINKDEATIPFIDRGFLYGDGLFETLRFDNKILFSPNNHLARLQKGLEIIDLKLPHSKKYIINLLNNVINKNNLNSGIIRLMITRGNADTLLSEDSSPSIYISIKPFYEIPNGPVKVIYFQEEKYPIIRFTPAIKSMNYLGNMLSKRDCEKLGGYEPVFYNNNNIITECAIRNIFYIKDNTIITPSLDLGILSGVMRDKILTIGEKLNFKISESHINFNDINLMDEAFISSTGIGLLSCYWDGWTSKYLKTKLIKKELFKSINIT